MTKKIFSIAMAAISVLAIGATAQTVQTTSTTDLKLAKEAKMQKTQKATYSRNLNDSCRAYKERNGNRDSREFEGLTLNETQKNQLTELKQKQAEQRKSRHDAMKAERKQKADNMATAKENKGNDKKEMREERIKMKEERISARRQYLKEVKNIVGDQNYVIYLENQYVKRRLQEGRLQKRWFQDAVPSRQIRNEEVFRQRQERQRPSVGPPQRQKGSWCKRR